MGAEGRLPSFSMSVPPAWTLYPGETTARADLTGDRVGPKASLEILLPLLGESNPDRMVQPPGSSLNRLSHVGSSELANVLGTDAEKDGCNADVSKVYADTIFRVTSVGSTSVSSSFWTP